MRRVKKRRAAHVLETFAKIENCTFSLYRIGYTVCYTPGEAAVEFCPDLSPGTQVTVIFLDSRVQKRSVNRKKTKF